MKYDLSCLGSALVDITFQVDDNFIRKNEERGIPKGAMTLIEKDYQNNLIQELMDSKKLPEKACGGSATNSVVAASLFGSECYMSCLVSDDDNGKFYLNDLSANGVKHSSKVTKSEIPSGQCLVMVSKDAERTMCTNLGINSEVSQNNVDEDVIKNSKFLLLEGYLIASPGGFAAYKKAVSYAKDHDTRVALSLSDAFIVNSFNKELKELIEIKCDLIFCNETEAIEFSGSKKEEEIFKYFRRYTPNLLVTKGADGCFGYDIENEFYIPGIKVKAIDTNGAGDMFAGAVLNGLKDKKSLEQSAKFGCFAASKIVQNSGPRLNKKEYREIKEIFSGY